MRTIVVAVGLIAAVLSARAGELALTLLASNGPHTAGKVVRVELVALNPSGQELPFAVGTVATGTLQLDGRRLPVELVPAGAFPAAVPAGGFAARRYDARLPVNVSGEGILGLELADRTVVRTALSISPATDSVTPLTHHPAPLEKLVSAAPAISAVSRNFTGRFLPNQPVYFIYGDADQAAKFQFSFDYRLATLPSGDVAGATVRTLRVGYTQRSVWDIDGRSSPFYDTSYMPEIAFSSDSRMPSEQSRLFTWLGWRASLQHESNGKDGADSRSLNTVYFRPRFILGTLGDWAFVMLPELQAYIGSSSDNSDIKGYRGYGKLRFYFGRNDRPTLMFTGWTGKDFDHVTYQLDLAVPTRLRWLNLESYLYAQYFNGYGESLRDYRHRSVALRVGVGLVR